MYLSTATTTSPLVNNTFSKVPFDTTNYDNASIADLANEWFELRRAGEYRCFGYGNVQNGGAASSPGPFVKIDIADGAGTRRNRVFDVRMEASSTGDDFGGSGGATISISNSDLGTNTARVTLYLQQTSGGDRESTISFLEINEELP